MKGSVTVRLALFLAWLLPAAGLSIETGGLPQLKNDISEIIQGLLSCYEKTGESRFLEKAIYFGEMRTHPLFELTWGKHRQCLGIEQRLLRASADFRARFRDGACPPGESESALCHLGQEYIQAADRALSAPRKTALSLPDACSIGRIQRRLLPGQVLLKYVLLDQRLLLFYVGADSAGYEFLQVGRAQAAALVGRLSAPLEDFANGRVDYLRIHFDMELAHRLFNIFLGQVTQRFPRADELFIIPDGELYKLPFEALVTGFSGSLPMDDTLFSEYLSADYLIQKYKVSYFFSYADFLRDFSIRKEYPLALAAFGDPLVAVPGPGSPPLKPGSANALAGIPSTRREIESLEKLFSGSSRRIFLGAKFTRGNFVRFAPQAKLIHVASHFFNDEEDPSRSAFLFSASGSPPSLCDTRQILELHLRAELVILSACESSEKDLLGFKLLSGMTAAIRQAGARDLIASLWPVDEFSSQVVPLFYRKYLECGVSATALRNAKLALFGKTIPMRGGVRLSLAHPFLWANYVLYHFYR